MNTSNHFKNFLSLLLLFLAVNSSVYAAYWSSIAVSGASSGCQSVSRICQYNIEASSKNDCMDGPYSVTIALQISNGSGGFTTVPPSVTKTYSGGFSEQESFSITQSGTYRFLVTGSHKPESNCTGGITSGVSGTFTVTIIQPPTLSFNVNGIEQYTNIPGSTYATVLGCVPVKVNYTGSGTVTSYRYSYKEVTSTGGAVSGGASFTGSWNSGTPINTTFSLATSKYYEITLEVTNGTCTLSKTSRIYTNPTAATASVAFKVNGVTLMYDCSNIPTFYRCSAYSMTLTNQSSNVSEYLVLLEKSASACGTYSTVYSSGYISTFPTDLKNLPGTGGTYLQSNNGYYRLTIYGKNACGILQSLYSGYMRVLLEPTPVTVFNVNGTTLPSSCSGVTIPQFMNCSALTVGNLSSYIATYQVKLFYSATDPCNTNIEAYDSGTLTYLPSDLKNLPGLNGTYMQDHPGYYTVGIITYGYCGTLGLAIGYMKVVGGPPGNVFITKALSKTSGTKLIIDDQGGACEIPYSTEITYLQDGTNDCNAFTFRMEESDPLEGNPVGKNTVFDLSNVTASTGNPIYQVTITTDMWNGSSWENINYQGEPETFNNLSNISLDVLLAEGYGDLTYDYYDYFSHATQGEVFRITIEVENTCGSSTQSQVIEYNTVSLKIATTSEEMIEDQASALLSVFPNPANSDVNFEVTAADKDKISISLYDLNGAHVKDIITDAEAIEGTNRFLGDLKNLTAGMYIYQVKVNNTVYKGKIGKE